VNGIRCMQISNKVQLEHSKKDLRVEINNWFGLELSDLRIL
jgi:hypothetical protein